MDKSILLQIIDGYLSVFALCALYIFIRYVYINIDLGYHFLRASIALTALCLGTIILRGPLFYVRTLFNAGEVTPEPSEVYAIGGIILGFGFLCMIKVFSPMAWGYRSWAISFLSGSIVVGISLLYVYGV